MPSWSDRVFELVTKALLALLSLFFMSIILSMTLYTNLNAFLSALFSEEVLFAIRLSLVTATTAAFLCVLVAVPAAYALSRSKFPGKDLVDTLLDLPIVMPPISLGAALLIFFSTPLGAVIESSSIKFVFQQSGIVLAQFTVISAVAVRFMKAAFDEINPRYENVARTLGCTKLQAFYRVTLPLAKRGLFAAIILSWARALGEFGATVMLVGATRMKTETLPIAIFLNFASVNIENAIAVIFILVMIGLAVLILIRKLGKTEYYLVK